MLTDPVVGLMGSVEGVRRSFPWQSALKAELSRAASGNVQLWLSSAQQLLGTGCWAQVQQHSVQIQRNRPSLHGPQGEQAISDGGVGTKTWGDFQEKVIIWHQEQ